MKQKVYIETSVISYLTAKPSRDIVVSGHQQTTYEWWNKYMAQYDCYISNVVIAEIEQGDPIASLKRIEVVKNIKILEYNPEIEELGKIYLKLFNIPIKSKLDALHLAFATWYKIDFLLSWNYKHISNVVVNISLNEYNSKNNLFSPVLCSPEELMEVYNV